MNRIYQVIWSKTKHLYVVVSELAHHDGKAKADVHTGGTLFKRNLLARTVLAALTAVAVLGPVAPVWAMVSRDEVVSTADQADWAVNLHHVTVTGADGEDIEVKKASEWNNGDITIGNEKSGKVTVNELNSWGSKLDVNGKTVTIGSVNDYSGSEFTFTGQEGVTVNSGINNKNSTIIEAKTGNVSIAGYLNVNYDGDVSKLNEEKDENGQPKLRGGVMKMTAQNGAFQMSDAGSVYADGESTVTIDSKEVNGINSVKSVKGSKITITDRNTSDLTFNSLSAVKGHLDISGKSITVNSVSSIYNSDIKLHVKNDIDIKSAFVTGHEDETNSWNFYDYAYQKWMGTTSLTSDEGSVKIEGGSIQSFGKDSTFSISAKKDVTIAGDMTAVNDAGMTDKSGKKTAAGITVNGGNIVDIGGSIRANGKSDIVINAGVLNVAGVVDSQANSIGTEGPSHITITADNALIKNTLNIAGGSEIKIHGQNVTIARDTNDSVNANIKVSHLGLKRS